MDEPTRYDEKLDEILRQSARIFADRGFHQASIRDISAETGISLSGLYYYFKSKEELLFLIQHHCFQSLLVQVEARLEGVTDPEERLRTLIDVHLGFFIANMPEMKVLSHEADALAGEYAERVLELKRDYVRLVRGCVEPLLPPDSTLDARTATFALFGQMNWIYNWYRPERDPDAAGLARQMADLFVAGLYGAANGRAVSGVVTPGADARTPDAATEPAEPPHDEERTRV